LTTTEPKLTPLRRQFLDIKQQQPDAILLFRLGDFYEMFDEDAERAAAVLQIVLTSREFGKGNRVSMCGVPYHAAPTYIGRLIEAGLRVAVCDQVGEVGRGLVERQVTRVITPGTVVDEDWLQPESNNYLAVAVGDGDARGLAYADITTGDLAACQATPQALARELARLPDTRPDGSQRAALSSLAGMVKLVLNQLYEHGMVQTLDTAEGETYIPTPRYRLQVRELAANELFERCASALPDFLDHGRG